MMQWIVIIVNISVMQYPNITPLTSQNIWQLLRYVLSAVVVLLSVILLALAMPHLENQLNRWGLLPRHEQMTELYVSDPKKLPKTYAPGKNHTVVFTVRNLEGRTTGYAYTLTASKFNHRVIIGEGSVALKQNESRKIRLTTNFEDTG